VPKWVKFILAIVLLPVCAGAARRCGWSSRTAAARHHLGALAGGGRLLAVIFLMLPKPMWIYVLGHELTHALWTWPAAGRSKK